ncbi:glycosyltransferase family 4 protein [Candidatus Roizmanbacteria bacterium]|nr:glycosyltransferase family 4 protein [Candidatus Roizmanbacteria bacterium]
MNLLILNWRDPKNPKSGGAEIVTMEHAKAWVKSGYQVTWFTSHFPRAPAEETIEGVEIVRKGNQLTVFFLAPWYYFFSGRKFDLVIDEIHGVPFFTPVYVKKPKIAFIHEVATDIWDYMYPFPLNLLGKWLEFFYFRLYKKVRFWTDANSTVADLVKHDILRNNCLVIPCPAANKTLDRLPEKEQKPTFIFISRLVKMKGVEEVVKAFPFILKELDNAQLWIIGTGEKGYLDQLKRLVREYGGKNNVSFFGQISQEQKIALLKKSHLLLHASVKEGWGLVVIEAASQATPAVVYNVAGLRDSVKNGVTGIVLKENTPQEIAKEALLLIKDKKRYKKFQENALKWAKSLTWEKATRQSLELIKDTRFTT